MSDEKEKIDKVKEMAKLSVLSNRISPFQETNLKKFPYIVFNDIKECKIEYDLSYEKAEKDDLSPNCRHQPTVAYFLVLDESKNTDNMPKRYEAMDKWVKNLFWKDVLTEIWFNGSIVYKSKKHGQ